MVKQYIPQTVFHAAEGKGHSLVHSDGDTVAAWIRAAL
jgi:hypothetical protein